MAKVQKDSCTRDSASMIRMGRNNIPHIRSACAFWGGAYGIEYDLRTANSSQNSLRSCEINSPPLSVCHLTIRLSLGRYDWLRFRNRCKASRTRAQGTSASSASRNLRMELVSSGKQHVATARQREYHVEDVRAQGARPHCGRIYRIN